MSLNVVDLVKEQITIAVLENASGVLGGHDASSLSGGLDSAIPALLGGLTGAGNAPGKARALLDTVNSADDSIVNDFSSVLGGNNSNQMIEQGSNALSGLMGSGMMGNLVSVLSSVTGMSRGGTGSLMGMLAPVIFGVLKKQVMGGGLDAGGLMSMLNGQKANVAKAMSANLRSQLVNIDGYPSFDDVPGLTGESHPASSAVSRSSGASHAADGIDNAASAAEDTTSSSVKTAKRSGGSIAKWLIAFLVVLGFGWVGITLFG